MRLLLIAILVVWHCFGSICQASMARPREELSACASWEPARRSGSPGCWARLSVKPLDAGGEIMMICVPRSLWNAWLASGAGTPFCGRWEGNWSLISPPENTPASAPLGLRASSRKSMTRFFRATRLPDASPIFAAELRRKLELARERADEWLAPEDPYGVLRQLITGTSVAGETLGLLGLLGFVHLLTASGIHLYAIARLSDRVLRRIACAAPAIPLSWAKALSAILTALAWLAAWLLGGARLGMLRPWLVICLRSGARRAGVEWRGLAPLLLALAVDLAVGAWRGDLGDPGRWIYALACAGGLLARRTPWAALGSWLLAGGLAAWTSGTLALATPLLSPLLACALGGTVYPLLLLGLALEWLGLHPPAALLMDSSAAAASALIRLLSAAVMQTELLWLVSRAALAGGALLGALTLTLRPKLRLALLAALLAARALWELTPAAWPGWAAPSVTPLSAIRSSALRVEQLDVGQGDAALVATRAPLSRELSFGLIDSGAERALGDRAWVELLARRGARRLDWIALTHLDEDHSGGVKRLGRLLPIGCVATAREQIESPRGQRYKQALGRLGIPLTDWSGGCVPYPWLAPSSVSQSKANQSMSAVFVPLERGGFYLSAGDADRVDEPRIGNWAAGLASSLPANTPRILKLSHHGSKTSSNPVFIRKLRPTRAWISVGAGNHYGHPSGSVLEEIGELGIPLERTDLRGCLSTD